MNEILPDKRTVSEKISDYISAFGGSWYFILTGMGIIAFWVTINIFGMLVFDPYPFILLNLFLSLIAAFQAPFILMSQRRCEIKQDMIYRSLFKEIKELVEVDLSLENEIKAEIRLVRRILRRRRKKKDNG